MKDQPDDLRADPLAAAPDIAPTREAGLDRLRAFLPRSARDYAAKRNHDLPGHPHVSTLSPWLRHRAVTEAEVAAAVLERHGPRGAEKFLGEVLWRTYFKGWLERRPGVWTDYRAGLARARDRLAVEGGLRREWEAACEGRTGIAPFDDWARQLVRESYLHNHARMWFASIWMHTLRLPWELGADLFLRHLKDGDVASNTLSWRWVGGLHTRGKVYRARGSNIGKFTGGRYDPETLGHALAREAPGLDGPAHPDPIPVPEDEGWERGKRTGLLLHDDDLHPAFLRARGLEPAAVAVLTTGAALSPLAVSRRVLDFKAALCTDALRRWGGTGDGAVLTDVDAVAEWSRDAEVEQIVAPYAPVGPTQDALDALAGRIGVPLVRPLRDWDAAAWPHATAGFFKLRSRAAAVFATVAEG